MVLPDLSVGPCERVAGGVRFPTTELHTHTAARVEVVEGWFLLVVEASDCPDQLAEALLSELPVPGLGWNVKSVKD